MSRGICDTPGLQCERSIEPFKPDKYKSLYLVTVVFQNFNDHEIPDNSIMDNIRWAGTGSKLYIPASKTIGDIYTDWRRNGWDSNKVRLRLKYAVDERADSFYLPENRTQVDTSQIGTIWYEFYETRTSAPVYYHKHIGRKSRKFIDAEMDPEKFRPKVGKDVSYIRYLVILDDAKK
jgi:hypothetical protein